MSGDGRTGARAVAVAVLARTGGHVVALVVGGLSIAITTRYLTVSEYAHYVTATVLVLLVSGLLDGGFTAVCVRAAAREERRRASFARQAVGFRLCAAFASTLIAVGFVVLSYDRTERSEVLLGVIILSAPLPLLALTAGWTVLGESSVRVGKLVAGDVAGRLAGLSLLVLVVTSDRGLAGVLVAAAGASLAAFLVLAAVHGRSGLAVARPSRPEGALLRQALPLGLALLLNVLYFRLDALLLSLLRPAREVALYGFSFRLLEVVLALGGFVLGALLPIMSAVAADRERWASLADRSFAFFQAFGLVVAVCGTVEAGRLVDLIGGGAYHQADAAVAILLLSGALSWVNGFGGLLLISRDLQGRALWLNVTALAVNLVANLCLVPVWGYLAAAWTTVASELVNFTGMLILVSRLAGYTWRPRRVGTAAALAAAALCVDLLLRWAGAHVLVALGAAAAIWAVGALRAGIVPREVLRSQSLEVV